MTNIDQEKFIKININMQNHTALTTPVGVLQPFDLASLQDALHRSNFLSLLQKK